MAETVAETVAVVVAVAVAVAETVAVVVAVVVAVFESEPGRARNVGIASARAASGGVGT